MKGGMVGESTQTQTQIQTEEAIADNHSSNVNLKEKRKKRRSRRSKQNSTVPDSSSVNEMHMAEGNSFGEGGTSNHLESNEQRQPRASNVAFSSLPTMHINGETADNKDGNVQNLQFFTADMNEKAFSSSCPEPFVCQESVDLHVNKDFPSSQPLNCFAQGKYFSPHWPPESITEALEKGDVFRALFHVNAHNRLEAYCKIDGVQTDVLINGVAAQNRAVEGDVVAIKVDPPSLWPKMKGLAGNVDSAASVDENTLHPEAGEIILDSVRGKKMVDAECHYGRNVLENGFSRTNGYVRGEEVCGDLIGASHACYARGPFALTLQPPTVSSWTNEAAGAVGNLCSILSAFPSKRPTGRVVGIIEMSPGRDTVVGFLGVTQYMRSRESKKKDSKKNKRALCALDREFVTLTPSDPKFSKMMVPLRSLPDCIKDRLEAGDATIEMDLVAARIVNWVEESNLPEARVMHSFGRGGEIEAQIAAISFRNSIDSSEFSPEALFCLPSVPWEIPREEFQSRKDLRNLCIFTIDPATASDLDDALSVERLSNGTYRVGVHIADVSYFVLPDTALDIDAQIRSTSVCILQHKLPMLPPLLSENLGSLSPGVDRLSFSMFWDINPAGEVLDRWIGRTIIKSCCKLSYEHAQDIIDGNFDPQTSRASVNAWPDLHGRFEWSDIIRSVQSLHEISKLLKDRRFNDGALSLESPKVAFLFDEDGMPCDSVLCGQKESDSLVEEFMLLANRTAAEVITRAYPTSALLRKQPEPDLRKLGEFEAFCSKNGLKLDISSSGQLHRSLEHIKGELKNDSVLLGILMSYASKPMKLAAYFCSGDPKDRDCDWGHYALAFRLYTHFTSPLRRYPDIVVHRTLAAVIEAEEIYLKHKVSKKVDQMDVRSIRCFTTMHCNTDAVASPEAQEALSIAASKYRVPRTETLADVAAHCNERKLASRRVKDATDKLYMWALLKKKEILCLEARVLGLGPRFMLIYIHKLAVERRIYYDEVEGLIVEWLDETSTLVLSPSINKHCNRRGSPAKFRTVEDVAWIISPCDSKLSLELSGQNGSLKEVECQGDGDVLNSGISLETDVEPAVFPLTVRLLSTIPVALHAVGGDDGPVDIGARLYVSSYLSFG